MTDLHAEGERVTFTATLEASAKEPWLGQDWVLGPVDASPWGIPVLQRDGQLNVEQWFAGQAAGGATTTTHRYVFDARASSLAVRGTDGAYTTVQASNRAPSPGAWMLAMRQRFDSRVQGCSVGSNVSGYLDAGTACLCSPGRPRDSRHRRQSCPCCGSWSMRPMGPYRRPHIYGAVRRMAACLSPASSFRARRESTQRGVCPLGDQRECFAPALIGGGRAVAVAS